MMSSVLDMLGAHLLQLSVVIVVAAIVVRLTSVRWPHLAFLICMLALLKCLVPPLISSPVGLFTMHESVAFVPETSSLGSDVVLGSFEATQSGVRAFDPSAISSSLAESTSGWGSLWGVKSALGLGWALGAFVVLIIAAGKYRKVNRIIGNALPAPRGLRGRAGELSEQLHVRRRVRILVSPDEYGPACVGVLRPTLVLPKTIVAQWPARLLDPVIAHELVHARRRDGFWGILQFVVQILWWFHPLVWWIGRRAQVLCERCCDEEVIASLKCAPADYAESLVRVLELKAGFRGGPFCHAMSPAEITGQRLRRLARCSSTAARGTSLSMWGVALIVAIFVLPGMRGPAQPAVMAAHGNAVAMSEDECRKQINTAIETENWGVAIGLLDGLVMQDPEDGCAVFFLGFALHSAGRLDEALVYHRRAAGFEALYPIATYNIACAHALNGDAALAVETLGAAVASGFLPDCELTDDADLRGLIGRADFAALNAGVTFHRLKSQQTFEASQSSNWAPRAIRSPIAGIRAIPELLGVTDVDAIAKAPRPRAASPRLQDRTLDRLRASSSPPRPQILPLGIEVQAPERHVEYETSVAFPGHGVIRTRVILLRAANGATQKVVECSTDGEGWRVVGNR